MSQVSFGRGSGTWRKVRNLAVLKRLEERLSTPGDTATRRFQKVIVVVVSLLGSLATVFNANTLFSAELNPLGWAYIGSAAYLALGGLVILARPSLYAPVTFLLLMDVLIFPPLLQVLSGGYGSGMVGVHWALLAPLGAALALGRRAALAQLGLFVVVVVGVALLEPFSRGIAPEISDGVMLSFNISSLVSLGVIAAAASLYILNQVERFRARADALLFNVLPASVADRLKDGESPIADGYDSVTVLFADIAGFTELSVEESPDQLVGLLNEIFSEFDDLAKKHGVEKIKTIGDAYMAATGLGDSEDDPEAMVEFAFDLLAAAGERTWPGGEPVRLRIGIHTGPVVAGVIGHDRFIYDLWGDAVNTASRMESTGPIGGIQVTEEVMKRVSDRYRFEERHAFPVKGKGMMVTYTLAGGGAGGDPAIYS